MMMNIEMREIFPRSEPLAASMSHNIAAPSALIIFDNQLFFLKFITPPVHLLSSLDDLELV